MVDNLPAMFALLEALAVAIIAVIIPVDGLGIIALNRFPASFTTGEALVKAI
jgi:hypothetical protein